MLTKLRLKNWRSLRDVIIDNLTPITVFVGANSSGKSNIVDAIRFARQSAGGGVVRAVSNWGGLRKIRTIGSPPNELTEIEFSFSTTHGATLTDEIGFRSAKDGRDFPLIFAHSLAEDGKIIAGYPPMELPTQPGAATAVGDYDEADQERANVLAARVAVFLTRRIQLLGALFLPTTALHTGLYPSASDPYIIDEDAGNVISMLEYMRIVAEDRLAALQADLQWLLGHVQRVGVEETEVEIRLIVNETPLGGREAPSVSTGTLRLIAMLAAYYALDLPSPEPRGATAQNGADMRSPQEPGVVIIEEADMSIHPLLLRNLVELLRQYTTRDDAPRQFILTTHNPMLLNLFEPEEVRIVERDENGVTTVNSVNMKVAEVWRKHEGDYNLGSLWTTRLLGGVPE